MVTYLFGLPGSGKTTYAAYLVKRELKRIKNGKSKYVRILCNCDIKGTYLIDFKDIGKYDTSDSLIIIDEATLDANSRNHKNFSFESTYGNLMHRHYNCDIWYISQRPNGVDSIIRDIVELCLYIRRLPFGFSFIMCIPKVIIFPEESGEVKFGYRRPTFLEIIFTNFGSSKLIYRPIYYSLFDSFERKELPVKDYKLTPYINVDNAVVSIFKYHYNKFLSFLTYLRILKKL